MELKDTRPNIKSYDCKEEFIAEYNLTKIRYKKLEALCNKIEAEQIRCGEPTKYNYSLELLRKQQRCIGEYLHLLKTRAVIENIEIT